jgi:hypothetical protein
MNGLQDLSYLVQSWVPWAVSAYYKRQFRLAPHNGSSLTLEMTAQRAEIHPPTTANQVFYLFKSWSKQHDNPAFWHNVHTRTFSLSLAMTHTWMTYVHSRGVVTWSAQMGSFYMRTQLNIYFGISIQHAPQSKCSAEQATQKSQWVDETSYDISPDKASSVGFHQNGDMVKPLPKHPDKYLNPDHESVGSLRTNELGNQESKLNNSCQCLCYDTYNISDKMLSHQEESSMKKKK